jgi:hypothetical protein
MARVRNRVMRVVGGMLAFLAAHSAFSFDVPMDDAAFTAFVAEKIKAAVGDTLVGVKAPLLVTVGPMQAHLQRLHEQCRADRDACADQIDRFAHGAIEVINQQAPTAEKSALRLVVRTTDYMKTVETGVGPNAPAFQTKPLVDGLVVVAVFDAPRVVRPLDERDLHTLGMSRDEVFDAARSNLQSSLGPLEGAAVPVKDGRIGTIAGNIYQVGRIAIASDWAPLARAQAGVLLVSVPTTDVVLYGADDSPGGVDALRALSRHTAESSSNRLSPAILRWTPEGWERLPG